MISVRADETGEEIAFALARSSLGSVLVARRRGGDSRGVCAILLGDGPQQVIRELEAQFTGAVLTEGDPALEQPISAASEAVERPWRPLDLPLDIRGTDFQKKVWDALRKIPPGTTTSYAQVAQTIGAPKALRAVAGACAANRLAIAIPCHRVLRSNGSLSGYRWGMERKRQLLEREKNF
ncbi:methylated-DNA--[protein]-cysteine S-methyltransferase [uncultured Rhodoblastus sp.]|uniref:methylated-DNA--[protein]-cysteine S-methyltransferase n=1 Tax=uncultured Rhodoblastus sp. TaxID=543037 RepID=UPI0025D5B828|nr:methylated-DNA--[protein]-cysteine S-methyltransferase [uncultured Rhodoblastus sp.]